MAKKVLWQNGFPENTEDKMGIPAKESDKMWRVTYGVFCCFRTLAENRGDRIVPWENVPQEEREAMVEKIRCYLRLKLWKPFPNAAWVMEKNFQAALQGIADALLILR